MSWRQTANVGLVALVAICLATGDVSVPVPSAIAGRGRAHATRIASDFDGDGFADLAVGVLRDDAGEATQTGSVSVLYGAPGGLSTRNQLWSQDSPGIEDVAEDDDGFGWAVAMGNFNGDGYADLAIGVPGEDLLGAANAGAVNVLYGSPQGLSATGNQFWHQGSPGIEDEPEFMDSFGSALAVGDFNGDGYADLAIGVPGEDVLGGGGFGSHGAVNVLYGSPQGLNASGNQFWHKASRGIGNEPTIGDFFGTSLSASDYNGDGRADLAIGVPGQKGSSGAVYVLYGSPRGLRASDHQVWSQDSPGIEDVAESFDFFGADIASGDFDGDRYDDVAVGVGGEDIVQFGGDEGAVNVLYGSAAGLTAEGNQFWHQDSPGIKDRAEVGDSFGSSLSAADYNGDGYCDLAVGVPNEDFDDNRAMPIYQAGAVNVLYGTSAGLTATGNQFWYQGSAGITEKPEPFDQFGRTLGADDYDQDGFMDLAVGVLNEEMRVNQAGALHVIYGTGSGLTSERSQFWHRGSPGIKGRAREGALFSWSLSGR